MKFITARHGHWVCACVYFCGHFQGFSRHSVRIVGLYSMLGCEAETLFPFSVDEKNKWLFWVDRTVLFNWYRDCISQRVPNHNMMAPKLNVGIFYGLSLCRLEWNKSLDWHAEHGARSGTSCKTEPNDKHLVWNHIKLSTMVTFYG